MEQILLAYGLPKETVTTQIILNKNTKLKVRLPDGVISTLKGGPLKLVDMFINLASSVSSMENGINTRLARA